ncbi:MAG: pirin family protein [Fimbriimonadales bacterium]|nr:pirin family protein [Fimbriimonadales bacterium]
MITIRRADERGHFRYDWLDTYHTFSFGRYLDPKHMGFRSLRVINEDRIQPGRGFEEHSHRDMEILTYVLQGTLRHKDNLGHTSLIQPGMVQRMSAGTGIRHSEFNASQEEVLHLLQVWILPARTGLPPEYEERKFSDEELRGRLRLIVSPDGRDGSLKIHQDVLVYAGRLGPEERVEVSLGRYRSAWVQVARGFVWVNSTELHPSDGAGITGETELYIVSKGSSEVLVFDLA